jgi:NDP-sugar pyrophosphorylase family protein
MIWTVTLRRSRGGTAIILAGGLGSRLGTLAAQLPKPMLPVGGRPFVEYLVIRLARSGFDQIVFATGHQAGPLRDHFGDGGRWDMAIRYSNESEPLGTAGAIRLAAVETSDDPLAILNGDSYLDVDPRLILDAVGADFPMAMALAHVPDASRFGRVDLSAKSLVMGFAQGDGRPGPATINAGIYGLRRHVLDAIPAGRLVSLEREILPELAGKGLLGIPSDGYFVDIGIPEVYLGLQADPQPLLSAVGVGPVG